MNKFSFRSSLLLKKGRPATLLRRDVFLQEMFNTQMFSCEFRKISADVFCRFFLMTLITTHFFPLRLKLKWLKNGGTKVFIVACIFLRIIIFFIKYKSDIVFSVFLSLIQNLMNLKEAS